MKRPELTHVRRNETPAVPEIQGKAKGGKTKANPLMETSEELAGKVFHQGSHHKTSREVFDTDLATDNIENNLPEADK